VKTLYVVKVNSPQGRELWLSEFGYITEHFRHAAVFDSATAATLEAFRTLPYDFEVIPTNESELESQAA
jgi:hypothetical protein